MIRKSLLVLACAMVCGGASAQSSVTVFGVVDAGISRLSSGGKSVTGLSNSANSSSRLGFRGVEDLGGGLSAGFWLEGGVSTDSGTGAGGGAAGPGFEFKRRATVSLLGNFGEVRLGRDLIASYVETLRLDPFADVGVGSINSFYGRVTGFNDNRRGNAVSYYLPRDLGGFFGQVQYVFGEKAGDGIHNGNGYGFNAGYKNGPLNVTVAYGKFKQGNLPTNAAAPGLVTDIQAANLYAGYDFGVVKPFVMVNQEKDSAASRAKYQNYLLGLTAPLGAGTLKFTYHDINDKSAAAVKKGDASKVAVGYVYDLSKRTALYATYAHLKNKDRQNVQLSTGGLSYPGGLVSAGGSANGYDFGLRHSF